VSPYQASTLLLIDADEFVHSKPTEKMSSSKTEDLSASVPFLDGSNWIVWETQMKAFLRAKGLWQITQGNDGHPEDLRSTTETRTIRNEQGQQVATQVTVQPAADDTAARRKEQLEWDNRDDQAIGYIMLKISHSLRTHVGSTASDTWTNLSSAFSAPGPAAIFNDFSKVINLRISPSHHLSADLNQMWDLFERLKANKMDIPNPL
jgi:hypothetical protein